MSIRNEPSMANLFIGDLKCVHIEKIEYETTKISVKAGTPFSNTCIKTSKELSIRRR
jgi:hypothetical protein